MSVRATDDVFAFRMVAGGKLKKFHKKSFDTTSGGGDFYYDYTHSSNSV